VQASIAVAYEASSLCAATGAYKPGCGSGARMYLIEYGRKHLNVSSGSWSCNNALARV
jgi:hypothetical protein